jgi:UDP-glucose:(heptosyl)LPS alpha-1,3-glucosyltransferase
MIDDARARARTAGVGDRVHFVGQVADPLPCYHAADLFALPSAYETGPLVLLEALACGLPVVSTATGLAPALVIDGVNGYVVPANHRSVRDAIVSLSSLDRAATGVAARSAVEPRAWSRIAEDYLRALATTRSKSDAESAR